VLEYKNPQFHSPKIILGTVPKKFGTVPKFLEQFLILGTPFSYPQKIDSTPYQYYGLVLTLRSIKTIKWSLNKTNEN